MIAQLQLGGYRNTDNGLDPNSILETQVAERAFDQGATTESGRHECDVIFLEEA